MKKLSVRKNFLLRILITIFLSLSAMFFTNCTFINSEAKDDFALKERPFSKRQSDRMKAVLLEKTTMEEPEIVIEQNGRLYYRNCDSIDRDSDFDMDEKTAVETAKNELKNLELLPKSEYRIEVDVIQPFEKRIVFFQSYKGLDILSDEEDGIVISFNKNGLDTIQYYWRDIVPISSTNPIPKDSMLDEEEAINIYKKELAKNHPEVADEIDDWNVIVSQAYRYLNGKSVKVWVCSEGEEYLNAVFIDMQTGELI